VRLSLEIGQYGPPACARGELGLFGGGKAPAFAGSKRGLKGDGRSRRGMREGVLPVS